MEKVEKMDKGITLIALVVTIVVLLILAGVSIATLTGENGILTQADNAKEQTEIASEKEQIQLAYIECQTFNLDSEVKAEVLLEKLNNNKITTESVYGDSKIGFAIILENKNIYEIDVSGNIEYKGKNVRLSNSKPIMMARDENYAFWKEEYRNKITEIESKPYIVSSYENSIEKWDVSKEPNQSVWAWIVDDGNDGYKLTIAANGKTIISNGYGMFGDFSQLKKGNLTSIDISETTNINSMFLGCTKLESINLKGWNTENIQNMRNLFYRNNNLTTIIGIEDFNTENVTDMGGMFYGCNKLNNLNVNNFNTQKVQSMGNMFLGCKISSNYLDLSKWDTSSLTNIAGMFLSINCKVIDLSSFDVSKITKYDLVFYGMDTNCTIYANESNIEWLKSCDENYKNNIIIK